MKKKYIIVGSNNFWYSTFEASNQTEIDTEIADVKKNIKKNKYEDFELGEPEELHVFETAGQLTIKL